MKTLLDLPNEMLLHLASYLNSKDLLQFSNTCQRLNKFFDIEKKIWKRSLTNSNLQLDHSIHQLVHHIIGSGKSKITQNSHKLYVIMHIRTLHFWINNNPQTISRIVNQTRDINSSPTSLDEWEDIHIPSVGIYQQCVTRMMLTARNEFFNTFFIRLWDQSRIPQDILELELDLCQILPQTNNTIIVYNIHVFDQILITDVTSESLRYIVAFDFDYNTKDVNIIWNQPINKLGKN